jgi:hypothetical protein
MHKSLAEGAVVCNNPTLGTKVNPWRPAPAVKTAREFANSGLLKPSSSPAQACGCDAVVNSDSVSGSGKREPCLHRARNTVDPSTKCGHSQPRFSREEYPR